MLEITFADRLMILRFADLYNRIIWTMQKNILVAVFLIVLTGSKLYPQAIDSREENVSDSLILLNNILDELTHENELIEQYKLFSRAESTLKLIADGIPKKKVKVLKKRLKKAFLKLTPPNSAVDPLTIDFTLVDIDHEKFYWSKPITERTFVAFLNEINFPLTSLNAFIHPNSHSLHVDKTTSKLTALNPDRAIRGINYIIAKKFVRWCAKSKNLKYKIPDTTKATAVGVKALSCWTSPISKNKDFAKQEIREMFGCRFHTLFIDGVKTEVLPEACYPNAELRLIASINTGKKLFLDLLKTDL